MLWKLGMFSYKITINISPKDFVSLRPPSSAILHSNLKFKLSDNWNREEKSLQDNNHRRNYVWQCKMRPSLKARSGEKKVTEHTPSAITDETIARRGKKSLE